MTDRTATVRGKPTRNRNGHADPVINHAADKAVCDRRARGSNLIEVETLTAWVLEKSHRYPEAAIKSGANSEGIMAKKKIESVLPAPTITAYKAFGMDFKCRDFQFEIGKTYTHEGKIERCKNGFHSCEYPIDMFNYYAPASSRFALVVAGGDVDRETGVDSKIASATVHIEAEIFIPDIVTAAIKWITDKCDPVKTKHATGYQSASSATGDRSASSATGYRSASSATGDQSASSATGYQSASSATGYRSASSATGYQSASSATGKNSVAMNIGVFGKAKADKDGAIVLCNHDAGYNIRHIRASKVGDNGIRPDVWYVLDDNGEFVETAA